MHHNTTSSLYTPHKPHSNTCFMRTTRTQYHHQRTTIQVSSSPHHNSASTNYTSLSHTTICHLTTTHRTRVPHHDTPHYHTFTTTHLIPPNHHTEMGSNAIHAKRYITGVTVVTSNENPLKYLKCNYLTITIRSIFRNVTFPILGTRYIEI